MKLLANIVAIVVAIAGTVFFLQGTNVLPVGRMAGQSQWTVIGLGMAVLAVGYLLYSNRRR